MAWIVSFHLDVDPQLPEKMGSTMALERGSRVESFDASGPRGMSTRQVVLCEESLTMYETQGHTSEFSRKRIEAFAGYHGWFGRTGYAEAFIRERAQTSDYLTVTPNDLSSATQTGRETLDRIGQFESGRADGDAR